MTVTANYIGQVDGKDKETFYDIRNVQFKHVNDTQLAHYLQFENGNDLWLPIGTLIEVKRWKYE